MTNKALIIGIHGLSNKPDPETLEKWWNAAIVEGLSENGGSKNPDFDFNMTYWANRLYVNNLHHKKDFYFDDLYNDEPYEKAHPNTLKRKEEGFKDDLAAATLDLGGNIVDALKQKFGMNKLADVFLGKLLKDLNLYYEDKNIRDDLRDRLRQELLVAEGRKIMVVAHSMGSIIAYDALTLLGQEKPDFAVDHFVTIGSPLGIPHVLGKIVAEFTHRGSVQERLRTPTVVRQRWVNFADRRDPVALDVYLRRDFAANSDGVQCEDDLVYNDYRVEKRGKKELDRNYHKSYGYLRTPEFSEFVDGFI